MREPDEQLNLLEEALRYAEEAAAGAAAEFQGGSACTSNDGKRSEVKNPDAHLRLLAAKRTAEEIEAQIALRRMKLSGRKVH